MKKIITICLPLFLIYNCGGNNDWPQSSVNQMTSECIDDGYSQTQCDCAIGEYQEAFSYLEIETILDDLNPSDEDIEKLTDLVLKISDNCGFISQ